MKVKIIPQCVGIIIKNDKREFVVLYRFKKPQGLALPAGHINKKESPIQAAIRETEEEIGVNILSLKLILHGVFKNACSLHATHEWFIYEATKWEGEPQRKEPFKHSFVTFMSVQELESWRTVGDVDPVWFYEILPRLRIIGPNN